MHLRRKNSEGNTNVLTISARHGLISQDDFFNKNIASEDTSTYFLLQRGDFAYNKSYSAGYPLGAIKSLVAMTQVLYLHCIFAFLRRKQMNAHVFLRIISRQD